MYAEEVIPSGNQYQRGFIRIQMSYETCIAVIYFYVAMFLLRIAPYSITLAVHIFFDAALRDFIYFLPQFEAL